MPASLCDSIKESLVQHLLESTMADGIGDTSCVVTLPIPTIDGRIVGVFIEPRLGNFFLVNDGGKAVNELILQGVKITDSIKDYLSSLAQNFGVSYVDEMFQCAGKRESLPRMIFSVGACSSLAMAQLVGHIAVPSDEPMRDQFGRALRRWARKRFSITSDVLIKGKRAQHRFDFLASPIKKSGLADSINSMIHNRPMLLTILSPGGNPLAAAQRFGFKAADLENTEYGSQPKIAIEDRSEMWTPEAKTIVNRCADLVIEIPTAKKVDARFIGEELRRLVA